MLVALDQELAQNTELHCMGGFVLAEYLRARAGNRRCRRAGERGY
ncbi:MAG: hypothetical protein QM736_23290 [Vicinamibacterales bacterium]